MKRIVLLLVCVAIGMVATPAAAGGPTIVVDDFSFSPDAPPSTQPGTLVVWDWAAGVAFSHNVRQDVGIFRSGSPTDNPAASYERVFSAGTFAYSCEVHGVSQGMDGVIRVRPSTGAAPAGLPFTVRWATSTSNTGEVFDVQFRVNDGPWKNWKTDTTRLRSKFGVNDEPVRVRDGRMYAFRARSQIAVGTPASGWSPVISRQG